jgi:hypothetical protein
MKPSGVVGILIVVAVGYWIRTAFRSTMSAAMTAGVTPACLELMGSTTTEDNGVTKIIGSVRNSCDRKYGTVIVSFKLSRADQNGPLANFPESVITASVSDLKPGDTKDFKTLPVSSSTTFRFDEMRAF